jgi:adenylate kinase
MLQDKRGWPQISTGDILRAMAKSDTELGRQIRETQSAGRLVSDEILADVVRARTDQKDCGRGYILDGYPRTLKQAAQLETLSKEQDRCVVVVSVDVDHDVLLKRLTGRRTCTGCGEIYNVYFKAPNREGVCDLCGKQLAQRSDDRPEAIEKRLDEYHRNTAPLMEHYSGKGQLISVDGAKDPDEVFEELCRILG